MPLPFTTEQFLEVFAEYNRAIWPAQNLLLALGLALVVVAFLPDRIPGRWTALGLALLWAWMGAVYHLGFFRHINPLALGFGLAFLGQAAFLILWAWRRPPTSFRPRHTARAWVGGLLITYAFVLYPKLATLFGHLYPTRPTFGLPCPTTIVTLGLLLWAVPAPPWWIWVIPLAWAALGSSATFALGIREDLGLLIAALLVILIQVRGWVRARPHASA